MAGSISFRTVINVTNGNYKDSVDTKNVAITQNTLGAYSNIVHLETGSFQAITPTDITTPGVCYIRNVDPSGYEIEIGASGTGEIVSFGTLASGYPGGWPLYTGVNLVGKSVGAGTASLDVRIYEK